MKNTYLIIPIISLLPFHHLNYGSEAQAARHTTAPSSHSTSSNELIVRTIFAKLELEQSSNPEQFKEKIQQVIAILSKKLKKPQANIAQRVGVAQSTISNILKGKSLGERATAPATVFNNLYSSQQTIQKVLNLNDNEYEIFSRYLEAALTTTETDDVSTVAAECEEAWDDESEKDEAFPSPSAKRESSIVISKVDFPDSDIREISRVKAIIMDKCTSDELFELNLSNKFLYFDWIQKFVEMLMGSDMKSFFSKIARINFHNNSLGVRGLQELVPLLKSNTLKIIDLTSNNLDTRDIHNFGTSEGDDEEMDREERIILEPIEKVTMVEKLVWISKSLFGVSAEKNPNGLHITEDIIRRHREYYDLAR